MGEDEGFISLSRNSIIEKAKGCVPEISRIYQIPILRLQSGF